MTTPLRELLGSWRAVVALGVALPAAIYIAARVVAELLLLLFLLSACSRPMTLYVQGAVVVQAQPGSTVNIDGVRPAEPEKDKPKGSEL